MNHLILDADTVIYRVGFASQKKQEDGTLSVLPEPIVLNMVDDWIRDVCDKTDAVTAQLYVTGTDNFRYKLATIQPYKGNRTNIDKPFHYALIKKYLIEEWKARITHGWEADDEMCIDQYSSGNKHIVASPDKDMKQCVGKLYNPIKGELIEIDDDYSHWWLCMQILTGDDADNIPGLRGIGPKKAEKALSGRTKEERQEIVLNMYDNDKEKVQEIGSLLHILRHPDDVFDVDERIWR